MQWTALVIKSNLLGGNRDIQDIVYTEADTKEEARTAITSHRWPDSWYGANSKTLILRLFPSNEIPAISIAPGPRKRRVRYK